MNPLRSLSFALLLLAAGVCPANAQGTKADYERAGKIRDWGGKVLNTKLNVTWAPDSAQLWYERQTATGKENVVIEAATGARTTPEKLPEAGDKKTDRPRRRGPRPGGGSTRDVSPDGKWQASIKANNVYLRELASNEEHPASTDGTDADGYVLPVQWSPDSQRLVVMRRKKGAERMVNLIESSPKDQLQPKLHTYHYDKPGDDIGWSKPHLFTLDERQREVPVSDALFPNPWSITEVEWAPDSSRFTCLYNQRGHQIERVLSISATTGEVKPLVEETSPTFIHYSGKTWLRLLPETNELVWMSERDGWCHLWLYDATAGTVKNQITKGEWVTREVLDLNPETRQVWFTASGVRPGQDPYYEHLCRANLDGTGFTILTEGDGTHSVQFSPDRKYFTDTWSRVDLAPVHELRRSADGSLVTVLETCDSAPLTALGWRAPEKFTAKGRDGATDIYGIIGRPTNFDPAKKYPVIEYIYAGPHDSFVPKEFSPRWHPVAMAELGFIVVACDGMGTSNRGKKFHDVCYKNLMDSGFPDRIAWIKAAATAHPEMDLTRVGIYGGSAGGQSTLAGMLDHPDFYKVGVADCGCHDNRMDKIWWNEQWMGWPVDDSYAKNSNVTHAAKLQGKLLLIVGELDHNVDPASTMQVVNALEKADKDFEMLVITGSDHGAAESPYGRRRRADFLVKNLLGVEPRAN